MGALKDRMRHDASHGAIYDADRRYIMMRADVLMGLLHQVPADHRPALLRAMADSVADNGGRSAQAYFQSLGGDARAFLDTMTSSSADVGWGVWRFHQDAEGFEPVDLDKARAVLKEIADFQVESRLIRIRHWLAIEKLLNADQKQKLKESRPMMGPMMQGPDRDEPLD